MLDRPHARRLRLLDLAADIDLACRVLAHQHDGERRQHPGARVQLRHLACRLRADRAGERLAINGPGHARISCGKRLCDRH